MEYPPGPLGREESWEVSEPAKAEDTCHRVSSGRKLTRRALLGTGISGFVGALGYQQWRINQLEDRVVSLNRIRQALPPNIVELAERTMPSVTRIERVHTERPFFPLPPPPPPDPPEEHKTIKPMQFREPHAWNAAVGSGFFLRREGVPILLTAGHVIWLPDEDKANGSCMVYPSWDRHGFSSAPLELPGRRTAFWHMHDGDMAALTVPEEALIPEGMGLVLRDCTKDPMRHGERVIAIGSPFGLDGTVTEGVVSNPDARFPVMHPLGHRVVPPVHMLQMSANVNSGNSGCPIMDMQGRVVALTTMAIAGSAIGVGVRADSVVDILKGWGIEVTLR